MTVSSRKLSCLSAFLPSHLHSWSNDSSSFPYKLDSFVCFLLGFVLVLFVCFLLGFVFCMASVESQDPDHRTGFLALSKALIVDL